MKGLATHALGELFAEAFTERTAGVLERMDVRPSAADPRSRRGDRVTIPVDAGT